MIPQCWIILDDFIVEPICKFSNSNRQSVDRWWVDGKCPKICWQHFKDRIWEKASSSCAKKSAGPILHTMAYYGTYYGTHYGILGHTMAHTMAYYGIVRKVAHSQKSDTKSEKCEPENATLYGLLWLLVYIYILFSHKLQNRIGQSRKWKINQR